MIDNTLGEKINERWEIYSTYTFTYYLVREIVWDSLTSRPLECRW